MAFGVILISYGQANRADAWIFGLFESASAEVKEIVSDDNSQTASLLKPMSAVLSSSGGETSIIDDSALMVGSGPMGTIADVEYLTPSNNKIEVYVVAKGDTLGSIAKMYGITVNTIMLVNNISNEKSLRVGQELVILPISGVKHKIKQGDTVQSIAKMYGGDVEEIIKYNDLDDKGKLVIGEDIIVPGGEIKIASSGPSSGSSSAVSRKLPSYEGYYLKPALNVRRSQGLHGNNAIDFAPLSKTAGTEPILASASGKVIVARYSGWNGGYGKMIVLSHSNGTQTLYAHAFTVLVNEGEYVERGQIIGFIGNTGKSTGPHLHFEVRGARNPF